MGAVAEGSSHWRAICVAVLAALVLTDRFVEMLALIFLWAAAGIVTAVRS